MRKAYLLGFSALALIGVASNRAGSSAALTNVVVSGTAQDCFAGSIDPVSGVSLAAFQVSAAGPIVAQLDTMRRFVFVDWDSTAVTRFDSLMSRLQSLVISTHALSRTASGSDGSFSFSFAPVDSVLVVGLEDMEDEPWYYSSKSMSGMANSSFILDMSRGHCGF